MVGVKANFGGGGPPDITSTVALGNPHISGGITHTYNPGMDKPHSFGGHIGNGF